MKFNYVLLAAAAALAVSAETAEECVKTQNCGDDVVCIAHCFNVPAPTPQQVTNVESCISKCNGSIDCYSSCIEKEFLGAGSAAQAVAGAAGNAAGDAAAAAGTAANAATASVGAAATNAVNATVNAANNTANATTSGASSRAAFTGLVSVICSALYFLF